jgi:hypothetical protein
MYVRGARAARYGGSRPQRDLAEDNQALMAELARQYEPEANKFGCVSGVRQE